MSEKMPLNSTDQARLRLTVFAALERFLDLRGGFATRDELFNFTIDGARFPLIDYTRGIRNPVELDATLSVVSSLDGPYPDRVDPATGLLEYAFREGDSFAGDNRKLRVAIDQHAPIIVFRKPMPNIYVPVFPAYVVGAGADDRHVLIALDEGMGQVYRNGVRPVFEKRYVERVVQQRLHQPLFRARVMAAYQKTCAICRLKHPELLDAAHIVADADEAGVPTVTNGLALCKIHHAAYDQNLLGISPDYVVHLDRALLDEVDGPMLRHGLQDMHGIELTVPARPGERPDRDSLAARFEGFGV
ncbi:MAG TPA: restriction endonuclease [Microbacterium sp.]|uniref:HNH endonuclease n=1 Tax=Microbacterium sp. UBA1612 TaxID=1946942 RepID=UPI000E9CB1A0|nr:HNH endonuclease [Microbacterium sp. UBA1612]HBS76226.1 restriction endonuclease [Microbacterium sp.]